MSLDLNRSLAIKTDRPIALFPIRLETRFVENKNELLVRIYPDTVHIDSFEPELTEVEIGWGKNFWQQTWLAGDDETRQCSAWAQLAEHFGTNRAAWIVQVLTPINPESRPSQPSTGEKLTVNPIFPNISTKKTSWSRAAHTQILPDKWLVLIYESEQSPPLIFEGNPITIPLEVGISPTKDRGLDADSFAADEHVGWLVNFEKAVEKGMGLRLKNIPTSIKRLIVFGINKSLTAEQGQQKIEALIHAHHHTQSIGFIRQGTPTNNTDDALSGYSTLDAGFKNSFRVERRSNATFKDDSNQTVTAKALGIEHDVLSHVREADAIEQSDAQHMNTALWHATWGYFLEQMMAGKEAPTEHAMSQARHHFERHVRARGPLPALRIGTQPYGVLPVISLKHWQPKSDDAAIDKGVTNFLYQLRDIWQKALAGVPKIPGGTGSLTELESIVAMSPVSVDYRRRATQRIALHSIPVNPDSFDCGNQTTKNLLASLGLTWTPRHIRTLLSAYQLDAQWPGEIIAPIDQSKKDQWVNFQVYCQDLINSTFSENQKRVLTASTDSLFFWLLREAYLREYLNAAARLLKIPPDEKREAEFEINDHSSMWKILERSADHLNPTKAIDYLEAFKKSLIEQKFDINKILGVSAPIKGDLSDFAAFFKSLDYLSQQPHQLLDILFRETVDLCSHRYDAWVTSYASKRLDWMRNQANKNKGIYIGGYGWVEDLTPTSNTENKNGFIHAPSLAHATTAAILRSGYESRKDEKDREALAINLSSARVRTALWILDGMRQGQSLGALLGYRLERGLHENHPNLALDKYIAPFRRISSLDIKILQEMTPQQVETLPTYQVVDGFTLLKTWQTNWGRNIPWGNYSLPMNPPAADEDACNAELALLEDAIDAISDLVIAESVHHVAQGNPVRAGATLSAIAEGETPPPELDIIRTPRSGIGITHRIALMFTGLPPVSVWGKKTARALAEPFLNAWMAQILGPNAAKATCSVDYLKIDLNDKNKTIVLQTKQVTLEQLNLAPIDLLYLPESDGDAQRSELEQRVVYWAYSAIPSDISSETQIRLTFHANTAANNTELSFAEILEIARAARRLVTSARAMTPRDLAPSGQAIPSAAEIDSVRSGELAESPLALKERAELTINNFIKIQQQLIKAVPENNETLIDKANVCALLLQLAEYSLPSAIPIVSETFGSDTPKSLQALCNQARFVIAEAQKRIENVNALTTDFNKLPSKNQSSPDELRDFHVARLHEIFGRDFRVLPRFNPVNTDDLHATWANSSKLQNNDPLQSVTWLQRIARVRDGAARLDSVYMYTEAIGSAKLQFTVGQLPHKSDDLWAAMPGNLSGSRLSLVILTPDRLDLTQPVTGLLIDEWVEVVPNQQEITGLTFRYDAPQSRPPQAILLAVPPDDSSEWNINRLADTLNETLDLAKSRTVDLTRLIHDKDIGATDKPYQVNPDSFTEVAQFLPALYFSPARAPDWKKNAT